MSRRRLFTQLLIFLVTTLIMGVLALPISAQPPTPPPEKPTPASSSPPTDSPSASQIDYVTGEILVKFKPGRTTVGAQNTLRAEGLQTLEVSPYDGLMRVKVPPGREAETIARLQAREDVEIASYNHIFQALVEPNDPYYSSQWALPIIEAPAAWDITTGSSQVIVAVVDSGLDTSHPEFSGRIVDARDEIDHDSSPQDLCDHGTHVSGISAAKGNNNSGVAGVAWDVKIMPVRALTGSRFNCVGNEYDIRDGINWAVSHGAKVINLSFGASSGGTACEDEFPFMSAAITNAREAGVLVVAASGNGNTSPLYCPARQAEAMAVGATTSSDTRASYSNFGAGLSVVAPGGEWYEQIYSTLPGSYGTMYGTSMATPHVSGLAALLWSLTPELTPDQVRNVIESTADDSGTPGWDQYYGHGRINARRAVETLVSLQTFPEQITFLVDDDSGPLPPSHDVQVTTNSTGAITWTAHISPGDGWLSIIPPDSGTVSAASAGSLALEATRPATYGTHTATLIVTGTTLSGGTIGPAITTVRINYVHDLHQYRFPIILRNGAP